jgi:DNA repair exonuclease SbcCD ATPase subunit
MSRLERLKSLIAFRRASLDAAERGLEDASDRLEAARKLQAAWQEAQGVLQQAAEAVQNVVHSKIAGTVTRCLQAVYDDSLSFHVEFDRKRGKTEARLFFKKDGNEVDPMEASGLGWCEVAAFALRLAVLKLHTPAVAQVLIADESFRFLDRQAKPRMAELLMQVSEQMQIQIVLVTHDSDFEVGKVVRL